MIKFESTKNENVIGIYDSDNKRVGEINRNVDFTVLLIIDEFFGEACFHLNELDSLIEALQSMKELMNDGNHN